MIKYTNAWVDRDVSRKFYKICHFMGSEWQNVSSKLKRRAHPENMKLHSFIHSLGFKVFSLLYFFYLLGGAGLALFAIY